MKERSLFGNAPVQQSLSLDNAGEARRRVELAQTAAAGAGDTLADALAAAKSAAATSPNDARIAQACTILRAAQVAAANAAELLASARRDATGSSGPGSSRGVMVDRERATDELEVRP